MKISEYVKKTFTTRFVSIVVLGAVMMFCVWTGGILEKIALSVLVCRAVCDSLVEETDEERAKTDSGPDVSTRERC